MVYRAWCLVEAPLKGKKHVLDCAYADDNKYSGQQTLGKQRIKVGH